MRKQIASIIAVSVLSISACSSAMACQDNAGSVEKSQKQGNKKERPAGEKSQKNKDGQQIAKKSEKKSDNKDDGGERLKCRPPKGE